MTTFVNLNIMDLYFSTDADILKRVGEKVKERRLEMNIGQDKLALWSGIGRSSVINLEKGKSVSLFTLIAILRALKSLERLEGLVSEEPLSPIAYAKALEGIKVRRRAAKSKNIESQSDKDIPQW